MKIETAEYEQGDLVVFQFEDHWNSGLYLNQPGGDVHIVPCGSVGLVMEAWSPWKVTVLVCGQATVSSREYVEKLLSPLHIAKDDSQ